MRRHTMYLYHKKERLPEIQKIFTEYKDFEVKKAKRPAWRIP